MSMKSINIVKLGERLLTYFEKSECCVQVLEIPTTIGNNNGHEIRIFRLSPRKLKHGKFQTLTMILHFGSFAANYTWDQFIEKFVWDYCGSECYGRSISVRMSLSPPVLLKS